MSLLQNLLVELAGCPNVCYGPSYYTVDRQVMTSSTVIPSSFPPQDTSEATCSIPNNMKQNAIRVQATMFAATLSNNSS
jgi:hypothetical protein